MSKVNCYRNRPEVRWIALPAVLLLFPIVFTACGGGGGGGGGGSTPSKNITITGQLNTAASRSVGHALTRSLLPNATINAYVWSDVKDIVATTTSDGYGNYSIPLPNADAGKSIVLEAQTVSNGVTTRYSTIVTGLTSGAITNADIDPATSLAAELDSASALSPTLLPNLSGSAFATITAEFRTWYNANGADLTVGGQNLQTTFGSGLKPGGPASLFYKGDAVITDALKVLADTGNASVAGGKQVVQMARSLLSGLLDDGTGEQAALTSAVNTQTNAANTAIQGVSAFTQRTQAFAVIYGNNSSVQSLDGLSPGNYQVIPNPTQYGYPQYVLNPTGPSSDGKSWVVTFAEGSGTPTNGLVLTLTPKNAIPTFSWSLGSTLNSSLISAGSLTVSVRNPNDATVKYDATLIPTVNTSTNTTVTLNASFSDSALTQPIVVTGTVVGTPASGAGGNSQLGPFTNVSVNASLTSQFGTAQITNLAAQWYANSYVTVSGTDNGFVGLKSLTVDSITAQTSLTPSAQVTLTKANAQFATPLPSDGTHSVLAQAGFSGADLKGSGYELKLSNASVTFVRPPNSVAISVPSAIQGSATYTSPQLTVTGSVTGTWSNPTAVTLRNPTPVTNTLATFPQGSINLQGTITPKATGSTYSANLTLTGSVSGTNGVATLVVNSITLGSESLTGTVVGTYPSTNGVIDNTQSSYNVKLTQQPVGDVITLSGIGQNLTGTIATGGGTKVADIGNANTLGLVDLGSVTIIKYTDGSFETAASILP